MILVFAFRFANLRLHNVESGSTKVLSGDRSCAPLRCVYQETWAAGEGGEGGSGPFLESPGNLTGPKSYHSCSRSLKKSRVNSDP